MANDNKIKKINNKENSIQRIESKFLPEEIVNIDGGVEIYSLEKEFAKSRKNKNWAVLIMVFIFVAIMVSLIVLFTLYTGEQDKKFKISFTEFEDLRLKEVLNSARMNDNNLIIRRNELFQVIIEMRNKILTVQNKYLGKFNSVLDGTGSAENKKNRLAELKKAETSEINQVRSVYQSKIDKMKKIINEIESEKREAERQLKKEKSTLGQYGDDDKVHALKTKKIVNTQKSGLAGITDYYENYINYMKARYNPTFKSQDLRSTIIRNSKVDVTRNLKEYDPLFSSENIISRERFGNIRENISDRDIVLQRLRGIEYSNSVPDALKSIDNISNLIVNDYENLWFSLAETVRKKNRYIEDYRTALDAVLKEKPESGYIISAKDISKISIHINRLIRVKNGDVALVFRGDDVFIGNIRFYSTSEGVFAKAVKIEKGRKIKPFDRILIKVK